MVAVPTPSPSPAVIPWLALPAAHLVAPQPTPVPSPPLTLPADAPPCTAAQLEGIGADGGAATGHRDLPIILRNRSSAVCWLEGYPDVAILDPRGRLLAQATGSTGRGTFFADDPVMRFAVEPGTPALGAGNGFG